MCLLKNALLVHLTLSFIKIHKSHPRFHSSSPPCSCHLFFCSCFLFALSSFFLPPICFPLLHLICTLHSLCQASFLFRWPAVSALFITSRNDRTQNLKPVRVYAFCVRLFIPYITMRAHASIILSVWFITSWSSGLLRKYGNYNCARLMMHMAPHTRAHFMNNVRARRSRTHRRHLWSLRDRIARSLHSAILP